MSVDDEHFGSLRLPRGGKHGYVGVRGGQGKKRDCYQAYISVAGKKETVPGLFKTPHNAAVALAQWKQQCQLGLQEEPASKKPRKSRSLKAETPLAHCRNEMARVPLQLIHRAAADSANGSPQAVMAQPALTPTTSTAVQLPVNVPAAVYGVPVTLGQLV